MRKNLVLAMTLSMTFIMVGAGSAFAEKETTVSSDIIFSQEQIATETVGTAQSQENNQETDSQQVEVAKTEVKNYEIKTIDADKIDELLEINDKTPVEVEKEEVAKAAPVITADASKVDKLISIAKAQLGKPYVYGSTGPKGFDCSGFTTYVFRQMGISLPRVASSQAYGGTRVNKADLQKGDLVFFNTYGGISHVGIYIENGTFIHASSYSGGGVKTDNINSKYYATRYVTAARYL